MGSKTNLRSPASLAALPPEPQPPVTRASPVTEDKCSKCEDRAGIDICGQTRVVKK